MASRNATPKFFSLAFHTRFFPAVLWHRLRPKPQDEPSPFASHLPMEFIVALTGCAVLIAIGLPRAMTRGSLVGWTLCGLGLLGVLALLVHSVRAQMGSQPSFDAFRPIIFFFCVALGMLLGVFAGRTVLPGRGFGVLGGFVGLLVGYALGIFSGLWIQRLGWIGLLVDLAAGCAMIGMLVVGAVLTVVYGIF